MQPNNTRLKRSISLISVSLIGLFTLYWLYSHSFISVTVSSIDQSQNITYRFVNQSNQRSTEIISSETKIKRLLPKGSYEVYASQDGRTYFKSVNTRAFLGSIDVQAPLVKENSREYVGDEPGFCMYHVDILYSYDCNNAYSGFRAHIAATDTLPTYVNSGNDINASIKGVSTIQNTAYMLLEYSDGAEIEGTQYMFYPLRDDAQLTNGRKPLGLSEDLIYTMQPYMDGGLVADSYFGKLKYYSSVEGRPVDIPAKVAENENLEAINISTYKEFISTLFSNNLQNDEGLDRTGSSKPKIKPDKGKSEVYVYKYDEFIGHYKFNNAYLGAYVCGQNRLCMYSKARLEVYDISSERQRLLFSVSNVNAVEPTNNGVLLVTSDGVLFLDTISTAGYMVYSFGGVYTFCGIKSIQEKVILCINNEAGESSAILLGTTKDNDAIDKKIHRLRTTKRIASVSVYSNYIYVTPDAGDLIYSPINEGYIYDPEVLSVANKTILETVQELGISQSEYLIINTLD